jgi:hypothetical protein
VGRVPGGRSLFLTDGRADGAPGGVPSGSAARRTRPLVFDSPSPASHNRRVRGANPRWWRGESVEGGSGRTALMLPIVRRMSLNDLKTSE